MENFSVKTTGILHVCVVIAVVFSHDIVRADQGSVEIIRME